MKRKQLIPAVLAGALAGAVLAGPASAGVAALTAAPSTQTFYVDGKQVDLEAYVIHGHNYVQLRDVGRAVDFGVAYDQGTNRVLVDTSSPYTEESLLPVNPSSTPARGHQPNSYITRTEHIHASVFMLCRCYVHDHRER